MLLSPLGYVHAGPCPYPTPAGVTCPHATPLWCGDLSATGRPGCGGAGSPPGSDANEGQLEIDVGPFKDVESLELFLGQLQPSLLLPRE